MDIADWRKKIDELDRRLVALLSERAQAAVEIGRLKRNTNLPIYEPERERIVFENVQRMNQGPLPGRDVVRIFERIMDVMTDNFPVTVFARWPSKPGIRVGASRLQTPGNATSALAADFLRKGIAQADGPVKHWMFRRRILIAHKITLPFELDHLGRIGFRHCGLDPRVGQDFQRLRVEVGGEIGGVRIRFGEQRIVNTNFGRHRLRRR